MIVLFNNKLVDEKDANISALDRGFLFGDGVFTTLVVDNGKILFFEEHNKRLLEHSKKIDMEFIGLDKNLLKELIIKNNATEDKYRLRISISRGAKFSYDIPKSDSGTFIAFLSKFENTDKTSMNLTIYPHSISSSIADVKTLSYFERFWIKNYAKKNGFDDCLVLSCDNFILEAAFANVFWIKDDVLFYPDKTLPYLQGITLGYILKAAKDCNIEVKPIKAKLDDLKDAYVYMSSSTLDFIPVNKIDDSRIDDLKILKNHKFEKALKDAFEKYKKK
jgi:4-amino-4-deoxychorismate lyase